MSTPVSSNNIRKPGPDERPTLHYEVPSPPGVPLYRGVLAGILLSACAVLFVAGAFMPGGPARVNVWTMAGALLVYGAVIRFQPVKR